VKCDAGDLISVQTDEKTLIDGLKCQGSIVCCSKIIACSTFQTTSSSREILNFKMFILLPIQAFAVDFETSTVSKEIITSS
jgi:hypothetical protein